MDVSTTGDRIHFSASAVDAFRRMSHDANPMHGDAAYARRTPFGTPVVFGMLGVLAALRLTLRDGPVRLQSLRCAFPGPLLPDTEYLATRADAEDGSVELRLLGGGAPKVKLTARLERSGPHAPPAAEPTTQLTAPLAPAPAELDGLRHTGRYGVDVPAVAELDALLGLGLANLPAAQVQALAWVSYCCGMLVPGRQSLIGDVDLRFGPDVASSGALQFDVRVERYDARFGSVRLRATLTDGTREVMTADMAAFSRPEPVTFSAEALVAQVSSSDALRGRSALVTGASRGLGAYLAGALGRHGADVIVNYRSGRDDAEELRAALAGLGIASRLAQADVSSAADCARLAADAAPGLDILVNNASPPIVAQAFGEQGETGFADFVAQSLQACVLPTRAMLPLLRVRSGAVVTISSEYVVSAPARFAHYVAAKAAIEGLMASLAREERTVRFVVARPPKLLTDQTNTNFDFGPRLHAAVAAARIIAPLLQEPGDSGLRIVDQFGPE